MRKMNYTNEAAQVLDKIGITNRNFSANICPDIIAGEDGQFWFSKEEREKTDKDIEINGCEEQKTEELCIVIVLESPHIDEFKGFQPQLGAYIHESPALGETGEALQNFLHPDLLGLS